MDQERIHHGACNLCEAICGLEYRVRGNEILSIRGDDADPLSHGHICPKAVALKDVYEDGDRLRKPVKRVGTDWQEIEWEEAFELVADNLARIAQAHGPNSVGTYFGNPNVHNYGSMTHGATVLGPIKSRSRFSATSVDQLPHQLVAMWMYGHQLLVPITDIDRCQFFLVLGANPMASNGSLMTVPDFRNRLRALQARGGRMVVLDPRRSETAEVADEHHFVQPGTDAAFLLAFLKILLEENLARPGKLAEFSDGLNEVRDAIAGFSLADLATHCGIGVDTLQRLAREFAQAEGAACYGRMGVSTQQFGTLCQWLIQLINLVTGNLDRPGGTLFTTPAVDLIEGPASKPGHFNIWQSRVRGLPEFAGELPVATLAEEILTPGEGQIRALLTSCGNPVLSTPNGQRLDTALESLEFMVCVDFYLNETTRHAHLILPPTHYLEHDHYDLIFHHFAVHNSARYSPPLFPKPEGSKHDWEIFSEISNRIALRMGQKARPAMRPDQIIDMGLQSGPYSAMRKHEQKLSLKKLKENPHGVDLGPLQAQLPQRLVHADKRIRCAPPELLADLQRFALSLQPTGHQNDGALRLIGRRHVRSNNSWMHNSHRLVKGPIRHQLLMHPADLAARGISSGQEVKVSSRVGSVQVVVEASDEMMRGVISLPHGWGHTRKGTRQAVAQQHAGVSCNDLTDDQYLDVLSGNAALNGLAVQVCAV